MPSTRGKFYKCNHRGYGCECKRCLLADKLEKLVAEGKFYVTNKKSEKPRTWSKADMLEEVRRLRGPQTKKNKLLRARAKTELSLADQVD